MTTYKLNQSAYDEAAQAVVEFVQSKLGEPKYNLERRDPTGRDYSMTPTTFGVHDSWCSKDCFGDFYKAPNGETHATYVSGMGLAANTYEDDIFEIVDNVICGALFEKYKLSPDDYDSADAQDFVSDERNDFMQRLESDYESSTIAQFVESELSWANPTA
tara:strand:- start:7 stop:486 length:480 start_codon:yes stop_codon:yes gene_type:complete